MREVLRDKRALLITLLLPALVFPIFEITFALMAGNIAEQSATRVTRVCILSKEDQKKQTQADEQKLDSPLDLLKEQFRLSKRTKLLDVDTQLSADKMILKGICDVVVKPNDEFSADV